MLAILYNKKQMTRHVPYRKLLIPAIQWWNPENKRNKPTSVRMIINWIIQHGNCGRGPQTAYGQRCIRRALSVAVNIGKLKRIRKSYLLTRFSYKK